VAPVDYCSAMTNNVRYAALLSEARNVATQASEANLEVSPGLCTVTYMQIVRSAHRSAPKHLAPS